MTSGLIYALKDNILTSIEDVERGKDCNCICPYCKKPLIAKKGKIKEHHFAHQSTDNCEYGYQTSLHLLAKEIFSEMTTYTLPPIAVDTIHGTIAFHQNGFNIHIDRVYLEHRLDNIIPDIVIETNNKKIFVEIYVTHRVDNTKLAKLKDIGISTIEVDLSKVSHLITKEELKEILTKGENAYWIYNAFISKYLKLLNIAIKHHTVEIPLIKQPFKRVRFTYLRDDLILNCPRRDTINIYNIEEYDNECHYLLHVPSRSDCFNCKYINGETDTSIMCIAEFDFNRANNLKYLSYKATDTLIQDYSKNYGIITLSKQFLEKIIDISIPLFELIVWYIADYVHIKNFTQNTVTIDLKSEKHRLFLEYRLLEYNILMEAHNFLLDLESNNNLWQSHKRDCRNMYNTWILKKIFQQVKYTPQKMDILRKITNY